MSTRVLDKPKVVVFKATGMFNSAVGSATCKLGENLNCGAHSRERAASKSQNLKAFKVLAFVVALTAKQAVDDYRRKLTSSKNSAACVRCAVLNCCMCITEITCCMCIVV